MNVPDEDTDRSPRTVAIALAATTAVQAIVTMGTLTVAVYAPQAAKDIGVGPEAIGLYASLTYIGAMIGTLTTAGFVLRYGAIRVSQVVMLGVAAGLALCVGAHWTLFAVSAIALGLGYGPTTPASSHILSRHTAARARSLVFSIKQTGVPMGGLLAGLLVPFLLVHFDWQRVTLIVVGIVIVSAVALQPTRRRFDIDLDPTAPLLRGNVIAPLRLVFARRDLRLLTIATFFFSATQQSYIYFLVTYLEVGLDWSNQHAGFALSVVGAAAIAGRILWGAVADATGRSRLCLAVMAFGMAASAAATASFDGDWPAWAILLVCVMFGATGVSWNGVFLAEVARRVTPVEVSRATGGALFVTFAGVVVAPPLFGLLAEVSDSFAAGYLGLALATSVVGMLLTKSALNTDS